MKISRYRFGIQIFFLLISVYLFIFLILGKYQTAHEFCPYSAVCFGGMFLNGGFSKLLFPVSVIAGLSIALLSIIFGRKFCGYICPIGTIQDITGLIKKRKPKYKFMNFLMYIKYPVFLLTVYFAYNFMLYITVSFCPIYAIAHPQVIRLGALFVLISIFVISIFIDRFFCRVLCPYAAFMNIIQFAGNILHIPRFKIVRNQSTCKHCNLCNINCPMGIEITKYKVIDNPECIHCEKCVDICPVDKGLKLTIKKIEK